MNKRIKVLYMLYIISIVALLAWGLPVYWIAIPSAVFIPVGCALWAACVYFQIRILRPKGKLFVIANVSVLVFILMSFIFLNIRKSIDFSALRWFFSILMGLSLVTLVLAITAAVWQYSNRLHEKTGDGKAESEESTKGEGNAEK